MAITPSGRAALRDYLDAIDRCIAARKRRLALAAATGGTTLTDWATP